MFLNIAYQHVFAQGVNNNGATIIIGQGAQLITIGNGKVINTGGGTVTFNGNSTIAGAFENNGTAIVSNNSILNVAGNWTNNGTFTPNKSSVILNGSSEQTIGGTSATTFYSLTINNTTTNGGVTIATSPTVSGTLNLTDGVITTGANMLFSSSTVGSVVQGNSNASYVNGNFRKNVGFSDCLKFTGTGSGGNDYVSFADNGTLDLQNNYTIEAWIYNTDAANNTIIDKGNYNFLFQTHSNGNTGLGLYNNVMGWKYSAGVVPSNTWSHVAVTFDLANNALKFYLNGSLLSTHNGISNQTLDNAEINIGRQSPSSCACNYFDGKMDELRVWNVTRSQSEIQQTMYGLLNGTEAGLKAYYQFEDGPGSGTLTDVSGNGNNGTLTNMDNANDWVSNSLHNTFMLPLGNGTATTNYYLNQFELTALNPGAFTHVDSKFGALATGGTLSLTEVGTAYTSIASEGEWHVVANAAPASVKYNSKVYTANISGLNDNQFTVVKRIDGSSDAADWACTPCGVSADPADGINANGGAGRMVANGYALRRGFTSFSKFSIAKASAALPVELLTFKASTEDNRVNLNWATASEINNDYFTVERSRDRKSWEKLSSIRGAGNSSITINYSDVDNDPLPAISFYRLKQTDFDGQYHYSREVSVDISDLAERSRIIIYPNPFDNYLEIELQEKSQDELLFTVTDIIGNNVFYANLVSESSLYKIILPETISEGVYFLHVNNGVNIKSQKIIKTSR